MATVDASAGRAARVGRWTRRLELGTVLCTLLLSVLAFVVLYPLVLLLINSFQVSGPGRTTTYSLTNWAAALAEPGVFTALVNTLQVVIVVQGISVPIAIAIAWLIARTDLPGASWMEFLFWI